jgi:prolyl oligopeptidase PreP (S9A serine peptidase family)
MSNESVFIDLKTRLRKFKTEFAIEFKTRIEDKTPVRSGDLKAGYFIQQKQEGFEISNTKDYFQHVNNGTPTQRPQRMLERTMQEANSIAEIAANKAGLNK